MCGPEDKTRQLVFDHCREMRLVNDGQHIVGTLNCKGDETRVLDDENLVGWVGNDGGLVLRDLDNRQPLEIDDSVGN